MKRRSLFTALGLGLATPTVLTACGGSPSPDGTPAAPSLAGESTSLPTLRIHVPTTLAFMAPMASFGSYGKLTGLADRVEVENWATPDVLKSLLINKGTDLAATPSYAAANMFNKGIPVRLVAVTVWGMLYVLGPQGSAAAGLDALRGKKVAVPLPNNMPDLVFRYLMKNQGLSLDGTSNGTEVVPYEQTPDAVNALLKNEVDFAVVPEHVATVASKKAQQQGLGLERTLNLQELWAKATGGQARFPMAGVLMPAEIADARPALVTGVLSELEMAVEAVNSLSEKAIAEITKKTEVPDPVVKDVIPRLQLQVVAAQAAKTELEDFYTRLSELLSLIHI